MSRGRYQSTFPAKDYDKIVIQQGRGNPDVPPEIYKPLLTIVNFSSEGFRTAAPSWLPGAPGEMMSEPELSTFVVLHAPQFRAAAILTQVALPPSDTLAIAKRIGVDHPAVNGEPIIMSTDLLVTIEEPGLLRRKAISVKRECDLDERTLQKLEIERTYWTERNVEWTLQLDTDIPPMLLDNMRRLFEWHSTSRLPCGDHEVRLIHSWIVPHLEAGGALVPVCSRCDKQLHLTKGTALAVAQHLMVRGIMSVDLTKSMFTDLRFIDAAENVEAKA